MAINGKVVLVTGSAQGIGRGIALRLAKDGADICLVDMNADKLAATAGEVRALGRKATTARRSWPLWIMRKRNWAGLT